MTTDDTEQTIVPSLSPSEGPPGVRFGPFALPTLSQILTPKKRTDDSVVETRKRVGSSDTRDEDDSMSSGAIAFDALDSTLNTDEPWYDSFSDGTPKSNDAGGSRTIIIKRVFSVYLPTFTILILR